ncbi:MAG: DUF3887 domain-containing protein [Armatimonadota bacterium]
MMTLRHIMLGYLILTGCLVVSVVLRVRPDVMKLDVGQRFATALFRGKLTQATTFYGADLQQQMTPEQLQSIWEPTIKPLSYQQAVQYTRLVREGAETVAYTRVIFVEGSVDVRLTFDRHYKISTVRFISRRN